MHGSSDEGAFAPDHRRAGDLPEGHDAIDEAARASTMAERCRLLHVHGPRSWHGTVRIVGNRNGLLVLGAAVAEALAGGRGATTAMAVDGEGYGVEVELDAHGWDHPSWETRPLPYASATARGEEDATLEVGRLRHALRMANAALVKRGVRPVPDPTDRIKAG